MATTSILIIEESKNQRAYWAEQLKRCSPDYVMVEASDGQGQEEMGNKNKVPLRTLQTN